MQEADAVINICKMKTHALERITGGVKNLYGCVCGVKKAAVKKTSASVSSKARASASKSKAKKAAVKAKTAPTPDREIENVPRRAGRPKGSGKYNEATKTIRIPVSMAGRIQTLADRQGLVCRLYDDQIQAGFPSPAGDSPFEELDFAEYLIPNPPATFSSAV